jgi:hypothetical protein
VYGFSIMAPFPSPYLCLKAVLNIEEVFILQLSSISDMNDIGVEQYV